jgi:hypothetical protein
MREERRLKVSENRVMRIFEPKRAEVTGEWRILQNEELNLSEPCVLYIGREYCYPPVVAFYIFFQQI